MLHILAGWSKLSQADQPKFEFQIGACEQLRIQACNFQLPAQEILSPASHDSLKDKMSTDQDNPKHFTVDVADVEDIWLTQTITIDPATEEDRFDRPFHQMLDAADAPCLSWLGPRLSQGPNNGVDKHTTTIDDPDMLGPEWAKPKLFLEQAYAGELVFYCAPSFSRPVTDAYRLAIRVVSNDHGHIVLEAYLLETDWFYKRAQMDVPLKVGTDTHRKLGLVWDLDETLVKKIGRKSAANLNWDQAAFDKYKGKNSGQLKYLEPNRVVGLRYCVLRSGAEIRTKCEPGGPALEHLKVRETIIATKHRHDSRGTLCVAFLRRGREVWASCFDRSFPKGQEGYVMLEPREEDREYIIIRDGVQELLEAISKRRWFDMRVFCNGTTETLQDRTCCCCCCWPLLAASHRELPYDSEFVVRCPNLLCIACTVNAGSLSYATNVIKCCGWQQLFTKHGKLHITSGAWTTSLAPEHRRLLGTGGAGVKGFRDIFSFYRYPEFREMVSATLEAFSLFPSSASSFNFQLDLRDIYMI